MSVINTHSLGRFWPVSWTTTHRFGVPKRSMVVEPQGALTCRSSTLTVLATSDPFSGLLLTVLGSRSDFMINEPRGAFTCRSATLTLLAYSGTFHGLLLIVLGSESDFND